MSFRNKLVVFFLLVVVVPMLSVGFVMYHLIDGSESGKADVRLASRQQVAINLTHELHSSSARVAADIAADPLVAMRLRSGDNGLLNRRLRSLIRRNGAKRIVISRGNKVLADTGSVNAILPTSRALVAGNGRAQGTLAVSVAEAQPFAGRVARLTGLGAVLAVNGRTVASTVPGVDGAQLPDGRGTLTARGDDFRGASYDQPGFVGQTTRVSLLEPSNVKANVQRSSLTSLALMMAGFLILALTLAWFVARSLHRQIESFLFAARRIGRGDFSSPVQTVGNDDFAQLGQEFNSMSAQLEGRVEDLRVERERLRGAMQKIGEAVALNLDRDGLLEVVVSAAADGVGAGAGRASVRRGADGPLVTVATTGDVRVLGGALGRAEAQAFATGEQSEIADGLYAALALPIRSRAGSTTGVVSIARAGTRFTSDERQLFDYLAGQASTSIENVDLHERVERQAVTDELTGLPNRRRFEERLDEEVERTHRFPRPVGLLMIDIDDFKLVNDRLGHQAGDEVLRQVANVVRDAARDIDLPARFGGEELALILPGAELDGATVVGERVRTGVEKLSIEIGDGKPVQVTVSVGVAALGEGPETVTTLVEAADSALYRAKRAGKNRTERTGSAVGSRSK